MSIGMIWAQDRNRILGTGSDMLWHVPDDFKFFKARTIGHPVVMGRASWEALGGKPLPGRRNIVMTRNRSYEAEGADVVGSLDDAITLARTSDGGDLIWIAGGANVYRQALEIADFIVVSDLDLDVSDYKGRLVYAPELSADDWEVDAHASDDDWRELSGDARWKVTVYRRR